MKKIFKFLLSRPELDGIVLGLLIAGIPLLFKGGAIPAEELLEAEIPEWDDWQLYLFAGIPAGALIASLCRKKLKLSTVTDGSIKNPLNLLKTAFSGIIGGGLFAAGMLMANDLAWNKAASAAGLQVSGGVFLAGLLGTAFLLTVIFNLFGRTAGKKKDAGK